MRAYEADERAERLLGDALTKLGRRHIEHARHVALDGSDSDDEVIVATALLHDVLGNATTSAGSTTERARVVTS